MSELVFVPGQEPLTIGAEIELQLLGRESLDLVGASPDILKRMKGSTKVHAELFRSMLEINSGICKDVHELGRDLRASAEDVRAVARDLGVRLAAAGTHPFALYNERRIFPAERYRDLIDRNQWIARRLMIFGLHVHVGMRDGEHAIRMNNALLHYLPLLLALSASSPYWHGEDTELASSRITFFEAMPTGGHPCFVQSWTEFEELYARLRKTEAVRSMKDIWWDVRPSPGYGTLEVRICDGLPTVRETLAVAALIHALTHFIDDQLVAGRTFAPPPPWIYRENKWRASRHGIEAMLIINPEGDIGPCREILEHLFETLAPKVAQLGYEAQIQDLRTGLAKGLSYQRQRRIADAHPEAPMPAVAAALADEFESDTPA